jgi:hypothetical protein
MDGRHFSLLRAIINHSLVTSLRPEASLWCLHDVIDDVTDATYPLRYHRDALGLRVELLRWVL